MCAMVWSLIAVKTGAWLVTVKVNVSVSWFVLSSAVTVIVETPAKLAAGSNVTTSVSGSTLTVMVAVPAKFAVGSKVSVVPLSEVVTLESDELVLEYQPVLDLATNEVAGFESFVRWRHPEHGSMASALPAMS